MSTAEARTVDADRDLAPAPRPRRAAQPARQDARAQLRGVGGIDQRRRRNRDEVRIAEIRRAIREGQLHRLRQQVEARRRASAPGREVEALEDVERFDQRDTTGRRRRKRDHLEPTIAPAERLAERYWWQNF